MNYLFIAVIISVLGGLLSFLSNIFLSISQDDINELSLDKPVLDQLSKLNNMHEYSSVGLSILETTLYLIASALLGHYILSEYVEILPVVLYFSSFLLFIFFQRIIFSGIAIRFNIKLAVKFFGLLKITYKSAKPLASLYYKIVSLFSGKDEDEATRDEINALVETAMEDGALDEDEYRLMKNVMHYSDVLVSDVMTPRTVVFSCEANKTVEDAINLPDIQNYSRFPIWDGKSLDENVVGYVVTKEILNAALKKNENVRLRAYAREIHYIPENAALDAALEQFIKLRQHIFLVVDEYGGIEGILSLEDILENILGVEIVDEADRVVDMRELAKQRRDRRIKKMIHHLPAGEDDGNSEIE